MMNKTLKRIIVSFMAVCLSVCALGCGSDKTEETLPAADDTAYVDEDEYVDEDYEETDDEYYDEAEEGDDEDSDDEITDDDRSMESELMGVTLHLPDEYFYIDGMFHFYDSEMDLEDGVFLGEMQYNGMTREELDTMVENGMTDEDCEKFYNLTVPVFVIMAVTGDRDAEHMLGIINSSQDTDYQESDLVLLKTVGDCKFYEYTNPDVSNIDNLSEDFQAEYVTLYDLKDEVLQNATYERPETASEKRIGADISFTTTDLNGNQISSDEIFSSHEITMVNVWATWCGYCVGELPDLEKLNRSLASKDCAVIGLCGDANDSEKTGLANALLQDAGVTYLNISPYDGWDDDFEMNGAWPSSFYVDRNGKMVASPLYGENVDKYEQYIDDILNGKVTAETPADDRSNTYANSDNVYRIRVVDDDLQPVEGAMVQFCTDNTCKMAKTDSSGTVSFDDPPGVYDVHVREVPKGYKNNTEEYKTESQYSDMVITVERD